MGMGEREDAVCSGWVKLPAEERRPLARRGGTLPGLSLHAGR